MRLSTLCSLFLALPVAGVLCDLRAWSAEAGAVKRFHPHFAKEIKVNLPGQVEIKISHITATFDADGAEKMKIGGSWHLANAHLQTSAAVTIGGVKVTKGRHALKVRKAKDKSWELVLDTPGRFKARISESGKALATMHNPKSALFEHLSIDLQPSGHKSSTKMYLDVRFHTHLARCEIELPPVRKQRRR